MSDLREALEKTIAEWRTEADSDEKYMQWAGAPEIHEVGAQVRLARLNAQAIEDLLAAHPVEPAGITAREDDSLVDWYASMSEDEIDASQAEAQRNFQKWEPVDPEAGFARPLLDRAAVRDAIRDEFLWAGPAVIEQDVESAVGHVMELARPMPTREQIERKLRDRLVRSNFADNLHEPVRTQSISQWVDVLAGSVSDLLNGTES